MLKPSTHRRYVFCLRHIIPGLGDIYVDKLTPEDVQRYVVKRMRTAQGHTVLNELRMLRTMAKDALNEGYAYRDFCARVASPKVRRYTKQRPNLLTAEQFRLVFAHIPEKWRGLVLLMVTTGLRWGEASALSWEDIDGNEATITKSNSRGEVVTVKTDRPRTVPILPEVWALLGTPANGALFRSERGGLYRGSPVLRVLRAACLAGGVERVTVHGLRRTFNNLARQMTSREVLKSITGHVTDTMVEHYSFVGADEKLGAASAVLAALQPEAEVN
jgi:integrase